ncbi:fasciclin domain-containing protein [candidate division KSB1 bacterium]|nr:fasciclin domain-containing protein [candidate division KSB1 bacterium]NIR71266.1 fasciclin domain-containing protein [candidate division KSB1 bacterium]NIS24795.1 fasciclin domain-containing protein [candidate division KSB1 bacterium]NIT71702.1 fasciclin domain-containing protein [candidate division KSB1 bacterium]NIU25431.1 fasciclin domain-containing protein [candidate division KSB1 bacterium]
MLNFKAYFWCLIFTSLTWSTIFGKDTKDIVDTAQSAGQFKTLVTAVKAAGLVETLQDDGPFTVFAPTDAAFAKLPNETLDALLRPENRSKLQSILTYHVVPGKLMANDVVKLNSAETVFGQEIAIRTDGSTVRVDDATVIKTNIAASNGIIHVIDSVILPKDIVDLAMASDSFNTLVTAVKAADLVETLKGEGSFTVFAPTDAAFEKLPAGTLDTLLKPENKEKLQAILTYHVVPGKVTAEEVVKLNSARTVNGQKVTIKTSYGSVMINDAKVIKTDLIATNGIIHVIDSVILPKE